MKDAAELFDMIYQMVETMMGLSSHDPRVSLVNDIVRLIDKMNVPLDRLDSEKKLTVWHYHPELEVLYFHKSGH